MKSVFSPAASCRIYAAGRNGSEGYTPFAPISPSAIGFSVLPLLGGLSIAVDPQGNFWRENFGAYAIEYCVMEQGKPETLKTGRLHTCKASQRNVVYKTFLELPRGAVCHVYFMLIGKGGAAFFVCPTATVTTLHNGEMFLS